jgi:hypothetical protein
MAHNQIMPPGLKYATKNWLSFNTFLDQIGCVAQFVQTVFFVDDFGRMFSFYPLLSTIYVIR